MRATLIGRMSVLAVCALFACKAERTPTQMVVAITSDWNGFERLTLSIEGFDRAEPVAIDLREQALPRRLVLVHDGGPLGPIAISVRAYVADRTDPALTETRSQLFFERDAAVLLTIDLPYACLTHPCQGDDVCIAGPKCVASDGASRLVPWNGSVRARGVTYHVDAGDVFEAKVDAGAKPDAMITPDAGVGADAGKPAMDGGRTAGKDAEPSGDAGGSHVTGAFPYSATNFNPDAHEVSEIERVALKLDCENPSFDSTTLEFTNWCGPLPHPIVIEQSPGSDAALIPVDSFEIGAGTTLQLKGERPVIFAVFGDAAIDGVLDASAHGMQPGAGASRGCEFGAGANGAAGMSSGMGTGSNAGGGGGGGFGSPGGAGGDAANMSARAGALAGDASLAPLRGGCGGGAGGVPNASAAVSAGGAGGGAIEVSVRGRLHVSGTIAAGGGGGAASGSAGAAGGGGGSGGAILLEAGELVLDATAMLSTNGGGGGAGQPRTLGSTLGRPGEDAISSSATAAHGGTAPTFAGSGGDGAAAGVEARAGAAEAIGGSGGGGGGAGRIRVQQAPSCTLAVRQSPQASIACPSCGACGTAPGLDCARMQFGSRTVYRCDAALSLQDARTRCQAGGADILSIRDMATNDWLKSQLSAETWIGASDAVQEGSWLWLRDGALFWSGGSSGSPLSGAFSLWGSAEPNNFSGAVYNADCAAIDPDGTWHDHVCSETHPYLCE